MLKTRCLYWLMCLSLTFTSPLSGSVQDPDSAMKEKSGKHSLFLSAGFGNNMILGSSISKPQAYSYGSLAYGLNNEFFLSAGVFHLPDFKKPVAFSTFSANYSHAFNSWADISASVSRYQCEANLIDTLFNSFFYADITAGFDWNIAYTKISISRVLSETGTTYLQLRNSRYFRTGEFSTLKVFFSFDPYVNLLFGSLTRISTSEGTSIGVSSPVWTGGGYGSGSGSGNGGGNGSGTGTGGTVITTTAFFGLMEADFGLPVGINIGNLTLEAEPGYVVPFFTDPSIPNPKGFTFLLNLYLKIL